ncbi:SOS response-associated peptidase [Haloglomus litoreum]|uniref:SOS response-associated peptidase n=1 Tax=Haloglomus litoreum TaxID=3034026 RepID=UPI0023E7BA69|nr:SOS response-associated peptidase [Haloglomus sp. DT116]
MCGRTSLFPPLADLEARLCATHSRPDAYGPRYNVAPADDIEVVTGADPDTIDRHHWGLLPEWSEGPGDGFINARAETVAEKPAFRESWAERPCLVPSSGFYEWQETGHGKEPYRVHRPDDLLLLGGVWREWDGVDRTLRSVTVLTTEPNDLMADLHDRMPVLLRPDEEETWLHGDPEERAALCRPYPDDDLEAYRIGTAVNSPTNDHPGIIERDDTEQSGLGEFA